MSAPASPPPRPVRRISRGERRVTYALKVLALLAVAIYLLVDILQFFGAIRATGLLVIGAIFFAYLITPLVRRLNDRLPLVWSILVVYVFIAVLGTALVLAVAPVLADQFQNLVKSTPTLVSRVSSALQDPHNRLFAFLPGPARDYIATVPQQVAGLLQTYGYDYAQKTLTVVLSTVSVLLTIVIVPVLAAYLLLDAENVRRQLLGLFPVRAQGKVDAIIDDLDKVVGGFIRGQLIDGAIVGLMIAVMLAIMHVPYALLIGVFAGVLNFIPYAGAVIGFVPSVILAFAYNGPTNALIVALLFAVIQQIDGNLVAPRVLKDNVGLSPLYIIIAILVGSELFGLVGTFLSVPVAAMLRVLREHLVPRPVSPAAAPPALTPGPRAEGGLP